MDNIGYRVKLNDYLNSSYRDFLNEYFSLFGIMEVKLNDRLISFNYSDKYIKYLLDSYKDRVSFHFNKNLLSNGLNDTEKSIINYLDDKSYSINCITHLRSNIMNIDDIERIKEINSYFNNSSLLTLENPEVDIDILSYIENISEVFHRLEEDNINTRLCIDWGHILLSIKDISLIFNKLLREDIIKYIDEYHIHNIINNKDHQTLCSGDIDYSMIYDYIKKYDNPRIILECEVNDMNDDGMKNINVLTKNK